MKKYFGTDGIRGKTNKFPMIADIILKIGMAIGYKFTNGDHRHRIIIGKDTRLSGYMVENALTAGLVSMGIDVFLVGPVPTPAVAMLTKSLRADAGIMISASHNIYSDNGIKIFNPDGGKLSDSFEMEIEKLIDSDFSQKITKPALLGKVKRLDDARGRYIEYVKSTFNQNQNLSNLKIVVDSANGAAYSMAEDILYELGSEVVAIGDKPDGFNINENCGSTKPNLLINTVLEQKADIGIALDGDADRLLIVDEKGDIIDGDKIIGLIAENMHQNGKLKKDTVVLTQMSNLALEKHLQYFGISVKRVGIGDRNVANEMKKHGYNLGGEQSGHIIIRESFITGDSLVAALRILSILKEKNKKMSDIANIYKPMPQILKSIPFINGLLERDEFKNLLSNANKKIAGKGRILVRKSGTEPIIRIMIEGKNNKLNQEIMSDFINFK